MKTHKLKSDVMILTPEAKGFWYVRMFDASKIATVKGGTERAAAERFADRIMSRIYPQASLYSKPRCISNYQPSPKCLPMKIWKLEVLTKSKGKFGFHQVRFTTINK